MYVCFYALTSMVNSKDKCFNCVIETDKITYVPINVNEI